MGNNTQKDLERAEVRAEILELRLQGKTYKEIAEIMGKSPSGVREICDRAVEDVYADKAEALMQITMDRLEALLNAAIDNGKHRKAPAWHDQALKVIAAQRRMLGLDKPTQQVVESKVTVSQEDLEKKLAGIALRGADEPVES